MDTFHLQVGGNLIGQGTYGCIFSPPLLVKKQIGDASIPNRIGKITQAVDAKAEILAMKYLSQIPNYVDYFLLPDKGTLNVPKPLEEQVDPELDDCKPIENYGYEKMLHFQIEKGGPNLRTTLKELKVSPAKFPYYNFCLHLLEAGSLLTLHKYVHSDIHSGNIVMSASLVPRLIDFGEAIHADAFTAETVNWRWKTYSPQFSPEPPEITLITAYEEKRNIQVSAQEIVSQKEGIVDADRLLGLRSEDQKKELLNFWLQSKAIRDRNWVSFFKLYWTKMDSWAIGSICLKVLRMLSIDPRFEQNEEWKKHKPVLQEVLRSLLTVNPYKRFDCLEALSLLDPTNAIISEGSGNEWITTRAKQRAATS